jgi:ABC-2 type transport system ATP-binding protein
MARPCNARTLATIPIGPAARRPAAGLTPGAEIRLPSRMPETAGAIVSVQGLTKRYGVKEAVRDLSFDVRTGEIFGLLGPNGAGKTTTLECLLGLRRPDAGRMTVAGIDPVTAPHAAKRRVGAVLQSAALQDRITPREALGLFRALLDASATPAALLDRFGLDACADAAFATLSGGEQQRLFLALAFVNDPPLVVLDEPTAGLDAAARRALHETIAGLRADGRTVLLSTHDLDEAERLCDRLGIIDDGRMVAIATPRELIARATGETRILAATSRPLTREPIARLPGVVRSEFDGGTWRLHTTDAAATVTALMRLLEQDANPLRDLRIQPPSLEDVFLELTGRPWTPETEAHP